MAFSSWKCVVPHTKSLVPAPLSPSIPSRTVSLRGTSVFSKQKLSDLALASPPHHHQSLIKSQMGSFLARPTSPSQDSAPTPRPEPTSPLPKPVEISASSNSIVPGDEPYECLVERREPIVVVGEARSRSFTIALAALRGSFEGIYSTHKTSKGLSKPKFYSPPPCDMR